jgi:hypothetical protein
MMRNGLLCVATAVAIVFCARGLQASTTLAYSFEDPAFDGFFGLGATASQDTIGATQGTHSLKYDVGGGGFVGARTETVIPAALGNPPGVDYVLFDMTITTPFTGGFGDIGVTVFGHAVNHSPALFGLQAQFADTESLVGKGPGLYPDVRIDLSSAANPITFANESFNQIFGPGPNQLTVASAFQFFLSKSAGAPALVYIDNVRLVSIPEPASFALLGLGAMGLVSMRRRKR